MTPAQREYLCPWIGGLRANAAAFAGPIPDVHARIPGIAGFVSFHASHTPPIALVAADGRGSLLLAEDTAADVS